MRGCGSSTRYLQVRRNDLACYLAPPLRAERPIKELQLQLTGVSPA